MMQIALVACFALGTILIACSAWLFSRAAYWAILALLAGAIFLAITHKGLAEVQPLGAALALVVYGAFVYFVSVQSLMQRKVTEITTREDFKREMQSANRFHGHVRAIYYLPLVLLFVGIAIGVIGKLSE
jgi:hypothetical protein